MREQGQQCVVRVLEEGPGEMRQRMHMHSAHSQHLALPSHARAGM